MNCWEFLGLEPTVDAKAIRRAYASLLRSYHPEDDPEGFKALREAYDEVLEASRRLSLEETAQTQARTPTTPEEPLEAPTQTHDPHMQAEHDSRIEDIKSAVDAFMQRAGEIYQDFPRRIDAAQWRTLLNDDVLWNLEVKHNVGFNLFRAIADTGNVPGEVFGLLEEVFGWLEQQLELGKHFSEEQLHFVLGSIVSRDWSLGYQGLEGLDAESGDEFIRRRGQGAQALERGDVQEALEQLRAAYEIAPKQADNLFLLGIARVLAGEREAASECFETLIEVSPATVDGYAQSAKLLYEAGRYGAALSRYQQALEHAPNAPTLLRAVADCYFQHGDYIPAKTIYQQVNDELPFDFYTRAQLIEVNKALLRHYREQLQSSPKDPALIFNLAETLFEYGDFAECIAFLIPHMHDLPQAYIPRTKMLFGRAHAATGQIEKAENIYRVVYELALEAGENGYEALMVLSEHILEHGKPGDALQYLKAAAKSNPNEAKLHYLSGEAARRSGDSAGSVDHYTQAIRLDPTVWYYFNARAMAYHNLERYREEVADLQSALHYEHMSGPIWIRLGQACTQLEQYDKAKEAFTHSPRGDFYLGYLSLQLKEYEPCVAYFGKYIEDYPGERNAHFHRGCALEHLGRFDEAIADFDQAEALDYDAGWCLLHRATCTQGKGDYEGARALFETSIKTWPLFGEAYHKLGQLYRELNDRAGALAYLSENMNVDSAYLERARFYEEAGDYEAAAGDLEVYLRVEGNEDKAEERLRLGVNQRRAGLVDAALESLHQAHRYAEAQAQTELLSQIEYQSALCHCTAQRFEQAQTMAQRALEHDAHNTPAQTLLAELPAYAAQEKTFVEAEPT